MNYAFHLPAPLILGALVLDAIAGDPQWLPHPVRLIGRSIANGEALLWSGQRHRDYRNGAILTTVVIVATVGVTWALIRLAASVSIVLETVVAMLLAWTTIAIRGLDDAAAVVEQSLHSGSVEQARQEIRALVGRDPESLDETGLIRAAVESVAENCSDGVIAPMLWLFVGGPVAAMAYKATNTLDSMIGYLDERYRWFGWSAARLDDLANLLPARVTALCLMTAAALSNRAPQAYTACVTSASMHRSPNAGFPEAAMAGALGIQLGGDAIYGGEIEHRPLIGIAEREPIIADIADARAMMRRATVIAFCIFTLARLAVLRVLT